MPQLIVFLCGVIQNLQRGIFTHALLLGTVAISSTIIVCILLVYMPTSVINKLTPPALQ
jgi:hypothetical protein